MGGSNNPFVRVLGGCSGRGRRKYRPWFKSTPVGLSPRKPIHRDTHHRGLGRPSKGLGDSMETPQGLGDPVEPQRHPPQTSWAGSLTEIPIQRGWQCHGDPTKGLGSPQRTNCPTKGAQTSWRVWGPHRDLPRGLAMPWRPCQGPGDPTETSSHRLRTSRRPPQGLGDPVVVQRPLLQGLGTAHRGGPPPPGA